MDIVAVHALELDGNAVDEKFALFADLQFSKADADRYIFSAVLHDEPVQRGRFRRPSLRRTDFKADPSMGSRLRCDDVFLGIQKRTDGIAAPRVIQLRSQDPIAVFSVAIGMHEDVGHAMFASRKQIYVSEDPRKTERVLRLEITAVAPFQDLCDQTVFSDTDVGRDIKFRRHTRALRPADAFAVDIQLEAGADTLKNDKGISFRPILRDIEIPRVNACGIVDRYVRRIHGKRIADIQILRHVVARRLPAARHVDLRAEKPRAFLPVQRLGDVHKAVKIGKIPLAVQKRVKPTAFLPARDRGCHRMKRYEIGALLFSVFLQDLRILVYIHFTFLSAFPESDEGPPRRRLP